MPNPDLAYEYEDKPRRRFSHLDQKPLRFHGSTYVEKRDYTRLSGALRAVYDLMQDGAWRTASEVAGALKHANIPSIESQIRNLRKPENGGNDPIQNPDGHFVERRNRNDTLGLSEYRLLKHRPKLEKPEPPMAPGAGGRMFEEALRKEREGK